MTASLLVLLDAQALPADGVAGTGVSTYAAGLLGALGRIPNVAARALVNPDVSLPDGVQALPVHRRAQRPRAQVIENSLRLPLDLRRLRAEGEVFHNLNYHAVPAVPGPFVQTLHDVIPLALPSPDTAALARRWRRFAPRYRAASAVIAVSRHAADDGIAHLGLRPERVHVAHHGVDPSFRPGNGPADPPYLLAVGEFSARKGFAEAFAVVDALADAGYPHRLIVAGWDRGTGQFRSLRQEMRHPDRMELRELVPDLVPLYQAASALVLTSRYEGFGLPALEAMACGTPVVAFDNSSLPEVIGSGGRLVAEGDLDAMVTAVRAILDSPALATELREAGIERARTFTWERSAAVHAEVYAAVDVRP